MKCWFMYLWLRLRRHMIRDLPEQYGREFRGADRSHYEAERKARRKVGYLSYRLSRLHN